MLNEIARNKLDEAGADRRTARPCTSTKCGSAALAGKRLGGFEARVHPSGITAAFAARREMELMRPWNSLRCYLYAFCNCLPQRSI